MAEEFHELRNFMNAWSQEQEEELHESSANRLYECKPVKKNLLQMLENSKEKRGKRLTSNWVHNSWNRFKQNTLALRIV